mmetsp:Transcript_91435/g.200382  ORF Transcript_91435/g.200382 Transcript_91435/m.200382 type:complete len:101 (+) Transcript_91435:498-800(+)
MFGSSCRESLSLLLGAQFNVFRRRPTDSSDRSVPVQPQEQPMYHRASPENNPRPDGSLLQGGEEASDGREGEKEKLCTNQLLECSSKDSGTRASVEPWGS